MILSTGEKFHFWKKMALLAKKVILAKNKTFFQFFKSFHRKIIAPSCSPQKKVDM
jgi:hypothetical protein